MDGLITLIIFSPVIAIVGHMVFSVFKIKGNATENTALNKTINNAIIDLYEQGYFIIAGTKEDRRIERTAKTEPVKPLHESILARGFGGDTVLTPKEFHSKIYQSRSEIIKTIDPEAGYDSFTKPSNRIYSDQADANSLVVLPLLLLGTPEGSHFAGNPAYSSDGSYAGSSDFGGDSGSGGDGGGGDGGGGD